MIVLADEYNVPIHKDICAMDSQVALVPLYFTYVYHIIPFPTLFLFKFFMISTSVSFTCPSISI